MKSNDQHILAGPWTRIAADVEQAFFRIERENRWLAAVVNGSIAGASVGLVAWMVSTLREGDLILFACLGSSAASVVFAPLARTNSLRTIISAYVITSVVCLILSPIHHNEWLPLTAQLFLAVSIPIAIMRMMDVVHPAAIGSALAFIIYDRDPRSISLLMLAILGLLTIVKVLAYIYLEDLQFKHFAKEFRRDYYGREVTVTVVVPESTTRSAPEDGDTEA